MCNRDQVNGTQFGKYCKDVHGIIRLYNKAGIHICSILPCNDSVADIALPSGEVLYCGIDYDLMRALHNHFPLEPLT